MDYSGNSNKSKRRKAENEPEAPKKDIKKVVDGQVTTVKKGECRKILDTLLPPDGVRDIKDHIILDVIIPTIKQVISDTVQTLLYPYGGGSKNNTSRPVTTRVSYNNAYNKHEADRYGTPTSSRRRSDVYDFEEVLLNTRAEALDVLASMDDTIDTYECVSVADFYEMVGLTGSYTDNNYGWMDLETAKVIQVRGGGWVIKLPRPMKLPSSVVGM